jgi:ectoine hydroxylase-related dioxygenase (phytanoyl-CoA dioxygenase family)
MTTIRQGLYICMKIIIVFYCFLQIHAFQSIRTHYLQRRHPYECSFLAKRAKEDLDALMSSIGLKPVSSPDRTSLREEEEQTVESIRISREIKSYPKGVSKRKSLPQNGKFTSIPLNIQLDYSRQGSAVLRSFIDSSVLYSIRTDLLDFSNKRELQAWRQKVEVASNDPILAKACPTIRACKNELRRRNINLDNLPFLQYFNTWRHIASVKDLCYSIGSVASVLMDVPSIRLYQDALFVKRANDGPTPWHTDARMAPFDTSNMITFWIPLQDIPYDGTALLFVPKSHNDIALPFWNEFDGLQYQRLDTRYDGNIIHYMPMILGDVTVHSGWALHCSNPNNREETRLALAVTYVDANAEIRENTTDCISQGGAYGDNEDQWSYKDWVHQVPIRKRFGSHPLIPIVWPKKTTKLND